MPEDIAAAVRNRQRRDNIQIAELISRGTPTVPVATGIDGGMNPTFLAAVNSRGGPGATIRTASGTIPAYVNPPAEPVQTATDLIELNGDDLRREPLEVRKATLPPTPGEH